MRALLAWTIAVSLLAALTFALLAYVAGQDSNWDFYNYHFYNAFAFVNDRWWFDIAPAQRQSFFSPFLDIPFYGLTQVFGVVTASLVYAGFQSLQAPAIFVITFLVTRQLVAGKTAALALSLALAVLSALSPLNLLLVGTTTGDNTTAVLVLWSIACFMLAHSDLAPAGSSRSRTTLCLAAALLAGLAVGLKLTNGPFALALLAWVFALGEPFNTRLRLFLSMAVAALLGFLIAYGYWGWFLHDQFQNPLFPLFNHIFQSEYMKPVQLNDESFKATTVGGVIFYPFLYNVYTGAIKYQQFLDLRLPVLYIAVVAAAIALALSRNARARVRGNPLIAGLLLFAGVSYLAWIQLFSITRYLVVLEVLAPIAAIVASRILFHRRWAVLTASSLLIAPIAISSWQASQSSFAFGHRTAWADTVFEVDFPDFDLSGSMVLITGGQAMAFTIPDAPADTRFVRIDSNLNYVGYTSVEERYRNRMGQRLEQEIDLHVGEFFVMYADGEERFVGPDLAYFGIQRRPEECGVITSKGSDLYICRASRMPQALD